MGHKPTLRNVRQVLGAGSFDTIGKMIQAHFDSNPGDSSTEVLFKRIADLQSIIQTQKIQIDNDLATNGDFSDQAIKNADQYQQVLIAMGDGYGKACESFLRKCNVSC